MFAAGCCDGAELDCTGPPGLVPGDGLPIAVWARLFGVGYLMKLYEDGKSVKTRTGHATPNPTAAATMRNFKGPLRGYGFLESRVGSPGEPTFRC
jgi:hypothetical protein